MQPQLKRPSSLTDLSHAHEEQEVEFLKLQVAEQRGIIDELTQVRTLLRCQMHLYFVNKSVIYLFTGEYPLEEVKTILWMCVKLL